MNHAFEPKSGLKANKQHTRPGKTKTFSRREEINFLRFFYYYFKDKTGNKKSKDKKTTQKCVQKGKRN